MKKESTTIVAFHIGRGGKFHNSGHKSFIGERRIDEFTDSLFLKFEDQDTFKDHENYIYGKDGQQPIIDLLTEENYDKLLEVYGITPQELGEQIYVDNTGNEVGLTIADANIGIGCIDQDGEYDTTYAQYLHECSQEELLLMAANFAMSGEELVKQYFNECSDLVIDWSQFDDNLLSQLIEDFGTFDNADIEVYYKPREI